MTIRKSADISKETVELMLRIKIVTKLKPKQQIELAAEKWVKDWIKENGQPPKLKK